MKKNDAELHSLIKSSRILEQFAAEQLDGVERRRHQRDQLVNLGIQVTFFFFKWRYMHCFLWMTGNSFGQ